VPVGAHVGVSVPSVVAVGVCVRVAVAGVNDVRVGLGVCVGSRSVRVGDGVLAEMA
jgi:hypothetical protein